LHGASAAVAFISAFRPFTANVLASAPISSSAVSQPTVADRDRSVAVCCDRRVMGGENDRGPASRLLFDETQHKIA
jgi:hypothetical protein